MDRKTISDGSETTMLEWKSSGSASYMTFPRNSGHTKEFDIISDLEVSKWENQGTRENSTRSLRKER